MDQFFQYDTYGDMWCFDGAFPVNRSAFSGYTDQPVDGFPAKGDDAGTNRRNVNKRMIDFLRRNWTPVLETKGNERERGYRHMMDERLRREKQKQSYLALLSMLPPGTKSDKNSIIQMTAKEIEELQRYKEELETRNTELEAVLDDHQRESREVEKAKIKLRVTYPSCGIYSVLEVLKCLKNIGSKTTAIQSKFSSEELLAVLDIETKTGAAEAEKAVQRTLFEVEGKFHSHFHERDRGLSDGSMP
ncbi:unnamed protein product [Ilex paraguariensis]